MLSQHSQGICCCPHSVYDRTKGRLLLLLAAQQHAHYAAFRFLVLPLPFVGMT